MLQPDTRLKAALVDARASQALLNELHQQILTTHDPARLSQLLGKYLALGASRINPPPAPLPSAVETQTPWLQRLPPTENRRFTMIASALKAAHDVAMNSIQNYK